MGYYTDFVLSIELDVNKELIGDESTKANIANYINSLEEDHYLSSFMDDGEFADGSSNNMKWYEHEEDMKAMSLVVQDVLFELTGQGEEDDDRWRKYFLNGKMQECRGRVVVTYPPFDMDKMK